MAAKPIAPASAEISAELTDFAAAYVNSQFMADVASPVIGVDRLSDSFPKRMRRDQATVIDDYVGARGEIPEVTYDVDEGTYLVKGRGQKAAVSRVLSAAADASLSPEQEAVARAMQGIKLARENRVATQVFTQGNWATGNTSDGSDWTDTTSGTPLSDMKTALQAIPFNGDDVEVHGFCSDVIFDLLQMHPDIRELIGGGDTKGGLATPMQIAERVGFDALHVSKIHKLTSARGLATETYGRIWSSTGFAFLVVPKTVPSPHTTVFSVTFRFNLEGAKEGLRVRQWHEPKEGIGGTDYVAVELKDDEVVIQNDAGYFLRTVTT